MHGMLKNIITMCFFIVAYIGMHEIFYNGSPQVAQLHKGQVAVDPACGCGKSCLGLKRTVWGTCAHVGRDQDSFLGLAVQVCSWGWQRRHGDWVIILAGALTTMMGQICGDQSWYSQQLGLADSLHSSSQAVAQIGGDGAREPGCQMGCVPCGSHNGALQTTTGTRRLLPAVQG